MNDPVSALAPLLDQFRGLRRRVRLLLALDGFALLVVFAVAYVTFVPLLDWIVFRLAFEQLPGAFRLTLLSLAILAAAWILVRRILRPLAWKISDDDVAVLVERQNPQVKDRLLAAIQLARGARGDDSFNSPELVQKLIGETAELARGIDPSRILYRRGVAATCALAGVIALAAAGTFALADPELAVRGWKRLLGLDVRWPQLTFLEFVGFDAEGRLVVARGEEVTLRVRAGGRIPSSLLLYYRYEETGEEGRTFVNRHPTEDLFEHTFKTVKGPFLVWARGGDAVTPKYRVETRTPPSLSQATLSVEYPAYIPGEAVEIGVRDKGWLPPGTPTGVRDFSAPEGARVVLRGRSNIELSPDVEIHYVADLERRLEARLSPDARGFETEFVVDQERGRLSVVLRGTNGLASRERYVYHVRGIEDRKPDILVRSPSGHEFVTVSCLYPVRLQVVDDYGVAEVFLRWRPAAQEEWREVRPLSADPARSDPLRRTIDHTFDFSGLGIELAPDSAILVDFLARDNRAVGAPNETENGPYRFVIVPPERLEEELQTRVDEIKRALEEARAAQEIAELHASGLRTRFADVGELAPAQQTEFAEVRRDQVQIAGDLSRAALDLTGVRERGAYNRLFADTQLGRLDEAIARLTALSREASEGSAAGAARSAAQSIHEAARIPDGARRADTLRRAEEEQRVTVREIQEVLRVLEGWSTFQEILRVVKDLFQRQNEVIQGIRQWWNRP